MKTETLKFVGDLPVKRCTLSNGLRILAAQTKIAPVYSYQTWYNVGSRDEEDKYSGMAHFFEHMMFKETKNYRAGEFDKTMESNGARDLNAFTGTDYTAYIQSLPVSTLDLVASLEAERMSELRISPEQINSEREVVHNERRYRNENNPDGQMYEELMKLAFRKHPYGRPIIGWEEDLNRMTVADCLKFYKSYYAPNNAVIAVVGNLPPEKVFKTVEKYYGGFASSKIERPKISQEPAQSEERLARMPLNIQIEKAYIGYQIPSIKHADQIPLMVLSTIMSTGRSSRLYRALVDKGITIDAGAGPNPAKDTSLFFVTFTMHAGRKADEAMAVIDSEIERISKELPTEEEMKRAKNKLRTEFFMGLTTNPSKANFLGQNETLFGDFTVAIDCMKAVDKVKPSDVSDVAKKWLKKNNRTVVIGVPTK